MFRKSQMKQIKIFLKSDFQCLSEIIFWKTDYNISQKKKKILTWNPPCSPTPFCLLGTSFSFERDHSWGWCVPRRQFLLLPWQFYGSRGPAWQNQCGSRVVQVKARCWDAQAPGERSKLRWWRHRARVTNHLSVPGRPKSRVLWVFLEVLWCSLQMTCVHLLELTVPLLVPSFLLSYSWAPRNILQRLRFNLISTWELSARRKKKMPCLGTSLWIQRPLLFIYQRNIFLAYEWVSVGTLSRRQDVRVQKDKGPLNWNPLEQTVLLTFHIND